MSYTIQKFSIGCTELAAVLNGPSAENATFNFGMNRHIFGISTAQAPSSQLDPKCKKSI